MTLGLLEKLQRQAMRRHIQQIKEQKLIKLLMPKKRTIIHNDDFVDAVSHVTDELSAISGISETHIGNSYESKNT